MGSTVTVGSPPLVIGCARVLRYVVIQESCFDSSNCRHTSAFPFTPAALAICQYDEGGGYYLFYCDNDWTPVTDSYHETIEDALFQGELECNHITERWRIPRES